MKEQSYLYNENSLDGIKNIEAQSVQIICTDPPYHQGLTSNGQKASFSDLNMIEPFYHALFAEYKRVLKPTGEIYFFCDFRSYAIYYKLMQEYFAVRNMIVWDKISAPGNHYGFSHELIIFATHNDYSPNKAGMNVWRIKGFSSGAKKTNGKKHIAPQKPVELPLKIISENSNEGDLVLDTFAGAGTTAMACAILNRRFIGFEIDTKTFEIAQQRIKEAKSNVFIF